MREQDWTKRVPNSQYIALHTIVKDTTHKDNVEKHVLSAIFFKLQETSLEEFKDRKKEKNMVKIMNECKSLIVSKVIKSI